MNIIIPMAGMGKRMRPHTLTVPKPLFKIAGKSIVERLIDDLSNAFDAEIENIGFVTGDFGKETEDYLLGLSTKYNAKGHIFYQKEALGTAHAVYMAKDILKGNAVVAFADTLFKISEKISNKSDNIIWCSEVQDPSAYGVVKENNKGEITDFVEKPKTFVSNKAIIGIYYFNNGEHLNKELHRIISEDIRVGNEYQLTTALEDMKNQKSIFRSYTVSGWYDCGNKNETVKTNGAVLANVGTEISNSAKLVNCVVVDPVFIGSEVSAENSVIGPNVSIDKDCKITNSIIADTIVHEETIVNNKNITDSIVGSNAVVKGRAEILNISDFSIVE